MEHKPVMAAEIVAIFAGAPDGVFIDATFGLGGHTRALLDEFGGKFDFIGVDRDGEMLERAEIIRPRKVTLHRMTYSGIPDLVLKKKLAPLAGVLFDLGLNSAQLDDASRGFSFMSPAPLDMRFDRRSGSSAAELLSKIDAKSLATIIRDYGQEHRSRAIAGSIVAQRPATTDSLASIIRRIVGPRRFVKSAARVFQALRIFINDELEELEKALTGLIPMLAPGGRLAVISYHSLEDGIVKRLFQLYSGRCLCGPETVECVCGRQEWLTIRTAKPLRPSEEEIAANSRARPARLRYAERK